MSDKKQNERSPEQQLEEINLRLKRLGYPWRIVKIYRDNAITGRYFRKRPAFHRMLNAIQSGAVKVDAILVDNIERFGRIDELPEIRKNLLQSSGVIVLTADTDFADPTTPQGKALGSFEAMRATEDGRIKAHNVFRGKRDAVLLKHWPGGPAPFGFRLESVMKTQNGHQEVDHSLLVPNAETDWIMIRLLNKADETSWGQMRLARFLNDDPEIPQKYKPFLGSTIGYWLNNPIYVGDLVWAKYSTDIIQDARVVERNKEEDMIIVRDFCQGLISREKWARIQAVRDARRRRRVRALDEKQIQPTAPGLTLKYLLTGLVRCGHCHRAMTVSTSGLYVTADGEEKRYTAYVCPGYLDRTCPNNKRVPEAWLRRVVINRIKELLFQLDDGHSSANPSTIV
jgi:DNA invertase Pin-like site-specific DNA recombinase